MSLPAGFTVEINFSGPGSESLILDDAARGLLDTGKLGGGLEWVDVTQYVRGEGSINRGISRQDGPYARSDAGTASVVLDNRDARFDPTNESGPYFAGGVTQVQPMRAWRIRGAGVDLFRGFADSWKLDYGLGGRDATVSLTGTDAVKVFSGIDPPETSGAVEDTGARIARILDLADWPDEDRDLDTGITTTQAASIAQALWTELLQTADTEAGAVYVDGAGRVVFRNRWAILTESRSTTSQATFGDGVGELPYSALDLAHDDTRLANRIQIAGPGLTTQTAEDLTSQANYLVRTFERSDLLMQTDDEALDHAQHVLTLLRSGDLRFDSVTINPNRDPDNLWEQALGRQLGDRITIKWTPPGRPGDPIERDVFIRGISHQFEVDMMTWLTVWSLQDAGPFDEMAVVGRAVVGTSRVAY